MASNSRWRQAQEYEKSFWETQAGRIESGEDQGLSWYAWRANRLKGLLRRALGDHVMDLKSARVLEVGSGPVGIVSFLGAGQAIATDPLCDYYSTQPSLVEHRSPNVEYRQAAGEQLDFPEGHFDLVIIDNVIDHVREADAVMSEIGRVLGDDGALYFTVNLHPAWGAFAHRILSKLRVDRGHPHTFTLERARAFLCKHSFRVKLEEWEDYRVMRRKDLRSPSTKDKLKGLLGLSEFSYTCVCTKLRR